MALRLSSGSASATVEASGACYAIRRVEGAAQAVSSARGGWLSLDIDTAHYYVTVGDDPFRVSSGGDYMTVRGG